MKFIVIKSAQQKINEKENNLFEKYYYKEEKKIEKVKSNGIKLLNVL